MIPHWHPSTGTLPTIRPGEPGHSEDRSPYRCTFTQLVERFATSQPRIAILQGLLGYRQALALQGIVEGFQWIDGSFVENCEVIRGRPPSDIDVVTFMFIPAGCDQRKLVPLFTPDLTKSNFKVDAYAMYLGRPCDAVYTRRIAYWYSMWSHRKTNDVWKGFLQIDLAPSQDADAEILINNISTAGIP